MIENASPGPINTATVTTGRWQNGNAPGEFGNFATDRPGIFLISGRTVYAADPSNKLGELTLTLDGVRQTVRLPQGEYAGNTVNATF
jgi:hypothetical protein